MSEVRLGRITFVGTTHVDRASIEHVREIISRTLPSTVAVELCESRYLALSSKAKLPSPREVGLAAWLISLMEGTFARRVGVLPGFEMVSGIKEALRIGACVEFIDMPIQWIISRINSTPTSERVRLIFECILVLALPPSLMKLGSTTFRDAEELVQKFSWRYPNLHRRLVKERDQFMARKLLGILNSRSGNIVVVVGLGHLKGLVEETRKFGGENL